MTRYRFRPIIRTQPDSRRGGLARHATALGLALSLAAVWCAAGWAPAEAARAGRPSKGYQIEVNKGRLIRLRAPAKTVFIANPKIADIQVKSPTLSQEIELPVTTR